MYDSADYFDMLVHHLATIFSLFYSYFTNWEDYALFILFASDIGDFTLNFGKVIADLKYYNTFISVTVYSIFMSSWVWSRNLLLPYGFFTSTFRFLPYQPTPVEEKYRYIW